MIIFWLGDLLAVWETCPAGHKQNYALNLAQGHFHL